MNPLRVRAENYRTYERLDVELPAGCTAIVGVNGSGKSSVLNVVELALFGVRSMSTLLARGSMSDLMLELEFEHHGELYRVRRRFSPAGRGKTTLDFEVGKDVGSTHHAVSLMGGRTVEFDDPHSVGWAPLTRASMAETQQLIEDTIGLSRDTFRASCFLAQGDGAAFTEALPAKRKEILAEVLGLGVWDLLADRARARLKGAETRREQQRAQFEMLQETASRATALENDLAMSRGELAAARGRLEDLERELDEQIARYQQLREQQAARAALADQLKAARAALRALEEREQQALVAREEAERLGAAIDETENPDLAGLIGALEAEKALVDEHRQKVAAYQAAKQLWDAHAARDVELTHAVMREQEALERLRLADLPTCDACGQAIGDKTHAVAAQTARIDEASQALGQHKLNAPPEPVEPGDPPSTERLQLLTGQVDDARTKVTQLEVARERLRGLIELATRVPSNVELTEARQAVAGVEGRIAETAEVDLSGAEARGRELRESVSTSRSALEALTARVAREEAELERAQEAERKLLELQGHMVDAEREIGLLGTAVRAYGRDGVPAMLVEAFAVPQIEAEANGLLAELGVPFSVELRTQRETKTGGLSEALDIVVQTPSGEAPYESFSGGERTRLNLSLRIGLARLLAHRRGADVRMLAIDEPEFLDDEGVEALARVLQTRLSSDFDRIMLVSHMPALRESFPQALVVSKDGERSVVELGGAS